MLVEECRSEELKVSDTPFEIVLEKRILITKLKVCQEGPVFDRSLNKKIRKENQIVSLWETRINKIL